MPCQGARLAPRTTVGTELIILFDGDSEALRAHRLSLAELGKPLKLLLDAVWRTASGIVGQASNACSTTSRPRRTDALATPRSASSSSPCRSTSRVSDTSRASTARSAA